MRKGEVGAEVEVEVIKNIKKKKKIRNIRKRKSIRSIIDLNLLLKIDINIKIEMIETIIGNLE